MKKCSTCDYFVKYKNAKDGCCSNELIASGSQNNPDNMMVTYGGDDGYGDYMSISPNFGCILYENTGE